MPDPDLCLTTGRTVTPAGTHGFTREYLLVSTQHSQTQPAGSTLAPQQVWNAASAHLAVVEEETQGGDDASQPAPA